MCSFDPVSMSLAEWINPKYRDPEKLKAKFKAGKPFEHLTLREFFLPTKANALLRALKDEKWEVKDADLFCLQQTNDLQSSNNAFIKEYYKFFESLEFLQYVSKLTDSSLLTIDAAGHIYSSGDYLLPHDDRLESRKVAYVVNLTKGFKVEDGGHLDFFATDNSNPHKVAKSFMPQFNTFFLFKVSDRSFHQVREVLSKKKRISIGGWFHG